MMRSMSSSVRFAHAARVLTDAARRAGLEVPTLRTPPRTPGAVRTIRRGPRGVTVSVQLLGRPWLAVLADCVDGVLAANRLSGLERDRARDELWRALEVGEVVAEGQVA